MSLVRWDPFRALRRTERDDLFDDFFRRFESLMVPVESGGAGEPAVEVTETGDAVTVKVQVPGVEKDQLDISITGDAITVRGEVRDEKEEKKKSYLRREFRYGAFSRTIPVPAEIDADKAKATMKNGVLAITAPKVATAKARKVDISVN